MANNSQKRMQWLPIKPCTEVIAFGGKGETEGK